MGEKYTAKVGQRLYPPGKRCLPSGFPSFKLAPIHPSAPRLQRHGRKETDGDRHHHSGGDIFFWDMKEDLADEAFGAAFIAESVIFLLTAALLVLEMLALYQFRHKYHVERNRNLHLSSGL